MSNGLAVGAAAIMKEETIVRLLALAATALIGVASAILPTHAQEYPTKQPIKIVISSSAGGLTDALARVTADFLQKRMGQSVVVDPRPGAAGTIGANFVAKAPADGYTIFLAGAEQAISPAVRPNLPYKFEDFTFLLQLFTGINLIATRPDFPANNIPELVAYMKANPGKVRYGSTGVGAIVHLGTILFEKATGTKGVHVPYQGVAPMYPDLLSGNIDITLSAAYPFPDGLKIIGVSARQRSPIFPDKLTLEEAGVKASWVVWFGFIAPPNLPQPIAQRLEKELLAVVNDPEAIAKFQEVAKMVPDEKKLVGKDFKEMALRAVDDWRSVAKAENIVINE